MRIADVDVDLDIRHPVECESESESERGSLFVRCGRSWGFGGSERERKGGLGEFCEG